MLRPGVAVAFGQVIYQVDHSSVFAGVRRYTSSVTRSWKRQLRGIPAGDIAITGWLVVIQDVIAQNQSIDYRCPTYQKSIDITTPETARPAPLIGASPRTPCSVNQVAGPLLYHTHRHPAGQCSPHHTIWPPRAESETESIVVQNTTPLLVSCSRSGYD